MFASHAYSLWTSAMLMSLFCLIQFCNAYLLQSPALKLFQCSEWHQARHTRIRMAGGFGNKEIAKKQPKSEKASQRKPETTPQSKFPALSTPSAQKAVMDVKQIVDNLDETQDPFWQLIEPLLLSEYKAADIQRVLDFVKFSTGKLPLPDSIVQDKWRPHEDIHAFMVHRVHPHPPHLNEPNSPTASSAI